MPEVIKTVGRYEILRELGRGGMAKVYLARQTDLDRHVALKELGAFQQDDEAFAQRFVRESRVAGSLSHPNIVTVHDYFQHEGTPYIAMEYVDRGSLRPWIASRKMTLAQMAGVLEGLLAALAHAETHGIVHRDLKPENIMVTSDGRVKITDFGIAKARNTVQSGSFLTATGTTVGTPAYMAPEQAMAQEVGPWTDIYSVGVMAWEMLIGHVPFHDSEAPMAILLRHVNEPIPLANTVDANIPAELAQWIDQTLVKDRTQRTEGAQTAWDELEGIVIDIVGPRWRREARLVERTTEGGSPVAAPRPLTPAPFDEEGQHPTDAAGAWGETPSGQPPAATPTGEGAPPGPMTPPPGADALPPSATLEQHFNQPSANVPPPSEMAVEPTEMLTFGVKSSPTDEPRQQTPPGQPAAVPPPPADAGDAPPAAPPQPPGHVTPPGYAPYAPQPPADAGAARQPTPPAQQPAAPGPPQGYVAPPQQGAPPAPPQQHPPQQGAPPPWADTPSPGAGPPPPWADTPPPGAGPPPPWTDTPPPGAGAPPPLGPDPAWTPIPREDAPPAQAPLVPEDDFAPTVMPRSLPGERDRATATEPRAGRRLVPLVIGGVVVAALVGFGISKALDGGDEAPTRTAPRPVTPVEGSAVSLRVPEGWSRIQSAVSFAGLDLDGPLVVGPDGRAGTGIAAGLVKGAPDPRTLLPVAFQRRIGGVPEDREAVQLGDSIQAFKYSNVRPGGVDSEYTVYAAPTDRGTAVVVCYAGSIATFAGECESVALTLALKGVRPARLGPDPEFAGELRGIVSDLRGGLDSGRRALAAARRPGARATRASAVAESYRSASRRVSGLTGTSFVDRDLARRLGSALRGAGSSYDDLARAARGKSKRADGRARQRVGQQERRVASAFRAFRRAGYRVG